MSSFPALVVSLPLIGFFINGIFGKKIASERFSGILGSGVVGAAFVASALMFLAMVHSPVEGRTQIVSLFEWLSAGSLSVAAAYRIDQLSILMCLIITGVGFLIHVYSIGYMRGDPGFWRFFCYLNLFIFMMLNLVLADNFLLMFLGWEGVGLCSYLLIGFWHDRQFDTGGYPPGTSTTSDAARKAFIVNRVGDFGFLVAMLLIFSTFGSLTFGEVLPRAAAIVEPGSSTIFWITLLLFLGAVGKSAQIPLYIWLPDAMAGPTPVSALIHAATMVTAGVYVVARCSILYALSPATLQIVGTVGCLTAIFAATIGLVQNDIKKILAYSTISQLGYMFLALGVGAFTSGMFHLITHAFFKALLFLGAGCVIHALKGEQDIRSMGGLGSPMPTTRWTFLAGSLAIAGIPPLSGFFSKDDILLRTYAGGATLLWIIGWITAGLTAFYIFRLFCLAFTGEGRWPHDVHPHEMPGSMTIPLVILSVLSVAGGVIGIPSNLGGGNLLEGWLEPIFSTADARLAALHDTPLSMEYVLIALSIGIAVAGAYGASFLYRRRADLAARIITRFNAVYGLLVHKYYVDEIYDALIVSPLERISKTLLWKGVDGRLIDGAVDGTAALVFKISDRLRRIQSGVAQGYALVFVLGIIVILGILVLRF